MLASALVVLATSDRATLLIQEGLAIATLLSLFLIGALALAWAFAPSAPPMTALPFYIIGIVSLVAWLIVSQYRWCRKHNLIDEK